MEKLTYGEMRTNAEMILDAELKERVLRGIDLMNAHVGPDWVDHIDPMALSMSSGSSCVVAQVFAEDIPSEEAWASYLLTTAGAGLSAYERESAAAYSRGMAILDGEAALVPAKYGFLDDQDIGIDYSELNEAWKLVFTGDEVYA